MERRTYDRAVPGYADTLIDPVCLRGVGWPVGGLTPFMAALVLER